MPPARLSPRKTPVQPRARETQDRILEAAARVFAARGYAAGTTNRIAAEAQMSVGSLYQYFPNKDAILVALVRRHVDEGAGAVLRAGEAARTTEGLRGRVALFVDAMVANHRDAGRLHQVLFEEAPRPRELLEELHALEAQLVDAVVGLLEATPGVAVGDRRLAAWFAVATVESLTHRYVSTHPEGDLDLFREELTTLVVAYLTGA